MPPTVESWNDNATLARASGVTSLAANLPAGVVAGDLLLLQFNTNSITSRTVTTPGWTAAGQSNSGWHGNSYFWRIADGTANDTPTAETGSAVEITLTMARISGHDPTTPLGAFGTGDSGPSDDSPDFSDVTVTENGSLIVLMIMSYLDNSIGEGQTSSNPAYSKHVRWSSGSINDGSLWSGEFDAGTVGATVIDMAGGQRYEGGQMVINPDPGGGGGLAPAVIFHHLQGLRRRR